LFDRDYALDATLDTYDQADIDDDEDVEELDVAGRRAVERKLNRRDREAAGRRGSRRRRAFMPDILGSEGPDSEDVDPNVSMLTKMKRRTRRLYDERPDEDEAPEDAGEVPYDQLQDIKANSITEWVSLPSVRKTIAKHFHSFLHTYTDAQGDSIYGRRIVNLGESTHFLFPGYK
jgi:DNA replication licensing factor MCM2